MQVSRVRALRGPNLWSHHTSVEAIVTCNPEEEGIGNLAGFEVRLRARFPALSPLQPTGHNDTIPMAHVFELAALDLQAQAGCPVTFSRTTSTIERGVYQVVVEYSEEAVGRLALELAERLVQSACDDTPFDLTPRWRSCANSMKTCAWGHPPDPSCRPPWRAISRTAA
jgi:cyanophycin synthetase